MEANSQDSTTLEIQVLNAFGAYQFSIYPTITSGDSLLNLDNLIDANLYPKWWDAYHRGCSHSAFDRRSWR
jgi:hypothetical protein